MSDCSNQKLKIEAGLNARILSFLTIIPTFAIEAGNDGNARFPGSALSRKMTIFSKLMHLRASNLQYSI